MLQLKQRLLSILAFLEAYAAKPLCYLGCGWILIYYTPAARAVNYTWSAGANGSWDTSTNWTPTGTPNASTDEAILSDATGRTISLSSSKNLGRIQFSSGGFWDINGSSFNAFGINTGGDFEFVSMTGNTSAFINNDIVFQNSPLTFNIASGSTLSLFGVLSGTNSLKMEGGGEMRVYGTNTFTGGITIDTGILTINNDAALGTSTNAITLTNNGQLMALSASPTLTASRTITLGTGGGALGARAGDTLTVNSVISGANNLTINKANSAGLGTVVLGATNTFTGNISIEQGALSVSSDANLGNAANDLTLNVGSTLSTTSTFTLNSGRNLILGGTSSVGTLNVAGGTTLTVAGNVSGASTYQFDKTGTGTVILTGTNTGFTGQYNIVGGILSVGSATNLGNPSIVNLNGTTLQTTGTLSYGGNLSLSSGGTLDVTTGTSTFTTVVGNTLLTKTGAGTLAFTGTNSGTFNYAINQGTLSVSGDAQLGNAANDLTFASGTTFQTTGATTMGSGRDITLSSGTVSFDIGAATSITGVISGTGAITKIGTGALTLSGTNTFSGSPITVNAGTFSVNSDAALGNTANDLTFATGTTFQTTGTTTMGAGRTITLSAGTVTFDIGAATSIAGVISGAGSITKTGTGTLTLSGTNTFSGTPITVNAGTLSVSSDANLGNIANDLTFAAGTTFQTTGTTTMAAGRTIALSSGTVTFDIGAATSIAGVISGTGALTKTGAGTLTLSAVNTFSGTPITINQGILSINSNNALGNAANDLTFAAGTTLQTTGATTMAAGRAITLSGGTVTFNTGGTTSIAGVISGTGALSKTGASTLTLTGANTFSGTPITVSAGTLSVNSDAALGNTANDLTFDAGTTFQTSAATTMGAGRDITLSGGTVTFNTGAATSIAGVISGAGAITKTGANTLTLTGANTFSGTLITVSAGTLSVNSDAALGNTANDLSFAAGTTFQTTGATTMGAGRNIALSLGTVTFNIGASTSIAGVISGAGALTKTGAGVLTLSGTNTFTGTPITVSAGTLSISNDANLGSTANDLSFAAGTTLQTTGTVSLTSLRDFTLSGGTVTFDIGTYTSVGGIISGAGSITKTGAGTLALLRTNTFSGSPITVNSGTLQINGDGALGNAANTLTFAAGTTFETSGGPPLISIARNITLNSGTVTFNMSSINTDISGTISGAGSLTKTGGGILTLSGTNTFSGGLVSVNLGTLSINSDAALGNIANDITLANNTTFQTTGATTMGAGRAVTLSSGTATINTGSATSIAGGISGSGGLIKTGVSTLTLSGANTYTGSTTVSAGTLSLNTTGSNAIAAGAGAITLNTGGTLSLAQANQIGDNVNLVLNGGTLSFTGTATSESLGTLSLSENSVIDFGGTNMILTFSGIGTFTAGKTLTILNWSGSGAGGGLDQIRFTNGAGLSDTIKSQIYFAYNNAPDWGNSQNYPVGVNELTPGPEPATLWGSVSLLGLALGSEYRRRLKRQIV